MLYIAIGRFRVRLQKTKLLHIALRALVTLPYDNAATSVETSDKFKKKTKQSLNGSYKITSFACQEKKPLIALNEIY